MSRETLFPCRAEGQLGWTTKTDVFAEAVLDPSLFFSSKLSSPQSPWSHQLTHWAAVQGPGGQMESKKQLCSPSRTTKESKQRRKIHAGWTAPTWIFSINSSSHLAVTVMPKPDFTSRPERMSSCFPHGLRWGEKLSAAWQQTPP